MEEEEPNGIGNGSEPDCYPYLMDDLHEAMQSPEYNPEAAELGSDSATESPGDCLRTFQDNDMVLQDSRTSPPVLKKAVPKNRSAYNLFIKDRYSRNHYSKLKHKSTKDQMQILTKEWREMPAFEKKRYQDLAKQEKIKYDNYKKSKFAKNVKKLQKNHPKSPLAPFTLFQMEERRQHAESFKNMSIVDVTKMLSQKWRSLSPKSKERYQAQFGSEKRKYEKAVHNLKVQVLSKEKAEVKKKPVHQPFVVYIKARYGELHREYPRLKHSDVIRLLSEEWKSLSPEEKQSFRPAKPSVPDQPVLLEPSH